MSARDKLNHARFYLDQFRTAKEIDHVRFNFSAFVSAWRSVTFVLQKDYRGKFGNRFDEWYAPWQLHLRGLRFADVLLRLRNSSQKEGDTFPLIVKTIAAPNGNKYTITWDLSKGENGLVRLEAELVSGPEWTVGSDTNFEVPEEEAVRAAFSHLTTELPGIRESAVTIRQAFAFEFDSLGITKREVLEYCDALMLELGRTVDSAEEVFGRPGYYEDFSQVKPMPN